MDAVQIGKNLTKLRCDKTQMEVAKALNISVSSLSMYETGSRIPRDEVKIKLANYYNVSIEELFFNDKVHIV